MNPESKDIDVFIIVHLIIWIIIGYIFPNRYPLAFTIMIIWEILEKIISSDKYYYTFKKYWTLTPSTYWNETFINKCLDMIMNILGYHIGSSIRINIK